MACCEGGPIITAITMENGQPASGAGQANLAIETQIARLSTPAGRRSEPTPSAVWLTQEPLTGESQPHPQS